jgi:N-acetylmuramoyl-L-alanine amidase/peptidoglycan hydrolase-like protein with peptidoglycan-binding domain
MAEKNENNQREYQRMTEFYADAYADAYGEQPKVASKFADTYGKQAKSASPYADVYGNQIEVPFADDMGGPDYLAEMAADYNSEMDQFDAEPEVDLAEPNQVGDVNQFASGAAPLAAAPTIVLDAGHGGYDFGAVNGSRREKDDNLRMTLAVGEILRNCGVNVVYTRTTDEFIPLLERSAISNRAGADLFVSFHRDSSTNPNAFGVSSWVYTSASPKSVATADLILTRVRNAGVQTSRGVNYANFSVLRETSAPATLLELGFISNAEDNRLFDANFNAYANAIASGILSSTGWQCQSTVPPVVPPPPAGDYAANVRNIQSTLNSRYNAGLAVDGIWGAGSNRALIRAFQIELNRMFNAGLATDGIWGPRTRAATRVVRQGDRNNLVWILQAALYVNGFPSVIDGVFGAQTDATLRNFQRANGLAVDGLAGPATFERLFARA